MNELSNSIFNYYLSNINELPFDKQFHFASRMYLWDQDADAKKLLDEYGYNFIGTEVEQTLMEIIKVGSTTVTHGSKNAAQLRLPYFTKYPNLKSIVLVMFRLMFLSQIYGKDYRAELYKFYPEAELNKLENDLLNDQEALAVLSTHAINFLYLYRKVICENEHVDTSVFIEAAKYYDVKNKLHLQLYIYLYTHCIIGESQFYYRAVQGGHEFSGYLIMMAELEKLIDKHFENINLDNKFEFLVCAALTGFKTGLEKRIFDEAAKSQSLDGMFLVDTYNTSRKSDNNSFVASEHRNALFILANREFKPLAGQLNNS